MKKYIKNRTIVDAMQWDGTPAKAEEIIKTFDCLVPHGMPALSVVTQYGMHKGDWMVTHTINKQVHTYVVNAELFANKYKLYTPMEIVETKEVKKKAKG